MAQRGMLRVMRLNGSIKNAGTKGEVNSVNILSLFHSLLLAPCFNEKTHYGLN